jgi:peroxiredoxin Q/BCP
MAKLNVGQKALLFCLPDADEKEVCLKDFLGTWVVLYFYPKDNTSGCTLEAIDFSNAIQAFYDAGAEVVGISPDSPKSHCNFRDKHNLKVKLLSDAKHEVLEKYGVWVLKKMYGRQYHGVERSTFIVRPDGIIAHVWRKVKVPGHIDAVKDMLLELQAG